MWKFVNIEVAYWSKRPMVWLFFLLNTGLIFFAVASEHVAIGGSLGNLHKNAPYIVQQYYMAFSIVCLLTTASFMNGAANRDFQYGMHPLVFTKPIGKAAYYFGKFIGACIVSLIPVAGISAGVLLGAWLSPWLPAFFEMCPQERFGAVYWSGHLYGMLLFGLPNVIIGGALVFALSILFRSNIVSYIGASLVLVLYVMSGSFTADIEKEWLANLLDPFGVQPFEVMTKYWTVDEKNSRALEPQGALLANRAAWLLLMAGLLGLIFRRFSFEVKNTPPAVQKSRPHEEQPALQTTVFRPGKAGVFSLPTFLHFFLFELHYIIRHPAYIIIVSIALIVSATTLASFSGNFGAVLYPVTYVMTGMIEDSLSVFVLGFITFYSGMLVWKARDAKWDEIQDATPVLSTVLFASKLLAMIASIALIYAGAIVLGMLVQTLNGYTRYDLLLYVRSLLVLQLSNYAALVVIALLFHYLMNNRYAGYFAFIVFLLVNGFSREVLEISSNMWAFNAKPSAVYSDMNGFGPFVTSLGWFHLYWGLFSVVVVFVALAFFVRGKEIGFRARLRAALHSLRQRKTGLVLSLVAFVLCGGFVFYNTQIINQIRSNSQVDELRADYERQYKGYEQLSQPKLYRLAYTIDLFPAERRLLAKTVAWAKNTSQDTIRELHFTMPLDCDSVVVQVKDARLKHRNDRLKYRIFELERPLAPQDSIQITFETAWLTRGFENEVSFRQLSQNGTFFNKNDILPSIGYEAQNELSDHQQRSKFGLSPRHLKPLLDSSNLAARAKNYLGGDTDWVEVSTVISTSADQTAVAPGSLVRQWQANGRNYFEYRLDQKSLNFYSFVSARYHVARKQWKGIDLEVYYDPKHATNVPNMLNGLEKSLEYYTTHFGPYHHRQCRILEIPRYHQFAQAFPGTMPYGEGAGFITDLRGVGKGDIDVVFDLVAHEMAHQYWAHQVCGAYMQGDEMLSESFAQYSALMVMEKAYGKDKIRQKLRYEMDNYLSNRSRESAGENPLIKTTNQPYLHYHKGSVALYHLKEMIGEETLNQALRALIQRFAYREPPYPTSMDAVHEWRKVTPDSLQYLITDLFERITFHDHRIVDARVTAVGDEYEVTFRSTSQKFYCSPDGRESAVPIADYVDIGVFGAPDDTEPFGSALLLRRVKITQKDNTFVLRTKQKPYRVGIDPYHLMTERVHDDNLMRVE